MTVEAVFENGVLRLLTPLALNEHERVTLVVRREGDDSECEDLLDIEYMDACAAQANNSITIEEVRQRLSKFTGSIDEAIDRDRGEH